MKAVLLPAPRVSRWSGGQTAEIALWPPESSYARRDFLWRLSSATVECETSVFTSLPDYDRVIALLYGDLTLDVAGQTVPLGLCQPYAFDGGPPVTSTGCAVDFNLMLRKGKCTGEMRPLHSGELFLTAGEHLFYAADPMTVRWKNGGCVLPAGGCLRITLCRGESVQVTAEPRGRAMLASVRYVK